MLKLFVGCVFDIGLQRSTAPRFMLWEKQEESYFDENAEEEIERTVEEYCEEDQLAPPQKRRKRTIHLDFFAKRAHDAHLMQMHLPCTKIFIGTPTTLKEFNVSKSIHYSRKFNKYQFTNTEELNLDEAEDISKCLNNKRSSQKQIEAEVNIIQGFSTHLFFTQGGYVFLYDFLRKSLSSTNHNIALATTRKSTNTDEDEEEFEEESGGTITAAQINTASAMTSFCLFDESNPILCGDEFGELSECHFGGCAGNLLSSHQIGNSEQENVIESYDIEQDDLGYYSKKISTSTSDSKPTGPIRCVQIVEELNQFLVCGETSEVQIWNLSTRTQIGVKSVHHTVENINCMSLFSASKYQERIVSDSLLISELAIGGDDGATHGCIYIVDVCSWTSLSILPRAHKATVTCLQYIDAPQAFTQDFTAEENQFIRLPTFLLSGSDDYVIHLWNVKQGTCIRSFEKHLNPITCMHSVENLLVSASADGIFILWDIYASEIIDEFQVEEPVNAIHLAVSDSTDYNFKTSLWRVQTRYQKFADAEFRFA